MLRLKQSEWLKLASRALLITVFAWSLPDVGITVFLLVKARFHYHHVIFNPAPLSFSVLWIAMLAMAYFLEERRTKAARLERYKERRGRLGEILGNEPPSHENVSAYNRYWLLIQGKIDELERTSNAIGTEMNRILRQEGLNNEEFRAAQKQVKAMKPKYDDVQRQIDELRSLAEGCGYIPERRDITPKYRGPL
jgi:hypothetical protein